MDIKLLAKSLIADVGGKENVASVINCITRLRLKLKNEKSADDEKIKRTVGVFGLVKNCGEYRIAVGACAGELCKAFKEIINADNAKKRIIFTNETKAAFKRCFKFLFWIIGVTGTVTLTALNVPMLKNININENVRTFAEASVWILLIAIFERVIRRAKKIPPIVYKEEVIYAPVSGEIQRLSEESKSVFSDDGFGRGVIIKPETNIVISPVDGIIDGVSAGKNAIMIKSAEGTDVIIHIGTDTAELKGRHFEVFADAGKKVRMGEPIAEFDAVRIIEEGYDINTAVVAAASDENFEVFCYGGFVSEQRPLIVIKRGEVSVDKRQKM